MSTETREEDLGGTYSFDDMGFDDDFGGEINPENTSSTRQAIAGAVDGFTSTVHEEVMKPEFAGKAALAAMPEGMETTITDLTDTVTSAKDEIASSLKDVKPQLDSLTSTMLKVIPEGRIKSYATKLQEKYLKEDKPAKQEDAKAAQDTALNETLDKMFGTNKEEKARDHIIQAADKAIDRSISAKQHGDIYGLVTRITAASENLSSYNSTINSAYQRKSLELRFKSMYLLREIAQGQSEYHKVFKAQNDAIVKNTHLPDFLKMQGLERISEFSANAMTASIYTGFMGDGDWLKNKFKQASQFTLNKTNDIIENIRDGADLVGEAKGAADSISDFDANMKGNIAGGMVASNALDLALGMGKRWMRNKYATEGSKLRELDLRVEKMRATAPKLAKEWLIARAMGTPDDGLITKVGRSLARFGATIAQENFMDLGVGNFTDDIQAPAVYTNSTNMAITKVIPGFLARMLQELQIIRTGDPTIERIRFDVSKRSFTTTGKVRNNIKDRLKERMDSESHDAQVDRTLEEITTDRNLSKPAKRALRKRLKEAMLNLDGDADYDVEDLIESIGTDTAEGRRLREELELKINSDDMTKSSSKEREFRILQSMKRLRDSLPGPFDVVSRIIELYGVEDLLALGVVNTAHGGGVELVPDAYRKLMLGEDLVNNGNSLVPDDLRLRDMPTSSGEPVRTITPSRAPVNDPNTTILTSIRNTLGRMENNTQSGTSYTSVLDKVVSKLTSINNKLRTLVGVDAVDTATAEPTTTVDTKQSMFSTLLSYLPGATPSTIGLSATPTAPQVVVEGVSQDTSTYQKQSIELLTAIRDNTAEIGNLTSSWFGSGDLFSFKGVGKAGRMVKNAVTGPGALLAGGAIGGVMKGLDALYKLSKLPMDVMKRTGEVAVGVGRYGIDKVLGDKSITTALKDTLHSGFGLMGKMFSGASSVLGTSLNHFLPAGVGMAIGLMAKGWEKLKKLKDKILDRPMDVYIPGYPDPVLLKSIMQQGGYYDKATGKPIRSITDIRGPVIDADGNVLLSYDMIKAGLHNAYGVKLTGMFSDLKRIVLTPTKKLIKGGQWALRKIAGLPDVDIHGVAGSVMGSVNGSISNAFGMNNDILTKIYTLLDERIPKIKKILGDSDGDGIRDGDEPVISRRVASTKEERDERREKRKGRKGLLSGILGSNKTDTKEDDKLGVPGLSNILKLFPASVSAPITAALSTATAYAGTAALVTAGVAGAYAAFKHYGLGDVTDADRVRYYQYGFSKSKSHYWARLKTFEGLLDEHHSFRGNSGTVTLSKEVLLSAYGIFGINVDRPDEVHSFKTWLERRFAPVAKQTWDAHTSAGANNPSFKTMGDIPKEKTTEILAAIRSIDPAVYKVFLNPFPSEPGILIGGSDITKYIDKYTRSLTKGFLSNILSSLTEEDEAPSKDTHEAIRISREQMDKRMVQRTNDDYKLAPSTARDQREGLLSDGPVSKDKGSVFLDQLKTAELSKGYQAAARDQGLAVGDESDVLLAMSSILGKRSTLEGMHPVVKAQILGLASEYRAITGKPLKINSGKRTTEDQRLLRKALGKGKAAAPGKSMHEFGFAADIDSADAKILNDKGLLKKYGFALPVQGEGWHLEPIGLRKIRKEAKQNPSGMTSHILSGIPGMSGKVLSNSLKGRDLNAVIPSDSETTNDDIRSTLSEEQRSNISTTAEAAKAVGVDPEMLQLVAAQESSFKSNAKGSGAARGLMQMMPGTHADLIDKYGAKHNIKPGTSRLDAKSSAILAAEYIKANNVKLRAIVKDPGAIEAYMTLFLGPSGAVRFLKAWMTTPNSSVLPSFEAAAKYNPNIFYKDAAQNEPRTYNEVYGYLSELFKQRDKEFGIIEKGFATKPKPKVSGTIPKGPVAAMIGDQVTTPVKPVKDTKKTTVDKEVVSSGRNSIMVDNRDVVEAVDNQTAALLAATKVKPEPAVIRVEIVDNEVRVTTPDSTKPTVVKRTANNVPKDAFGLTN